MWAREMAQAVRLLVMQASASKFSPHYSCMKPSVRLLYQCWGDEDGWILGAV